jgi:hypothetical protein
MLTKKDKQSKKNTEGDDDSLDMNVFEKLMEGKHTKIVNKSNDDLISINDTDTFDYSMQDKMTNKNLLNSRSPNCARAHTHRQVRALLEPLRLELPCRMYML